ncbi:MAG: phospholipase D-like domain-containing protein [Planctomycetaceae bacterium]
MLYELLTSSWTLFLAIDHLIVIAIASSHVVLTKRDSRAALGWVGVIWLAPFIGGLLYIVFGINRLRRKARGMRMPRRDNAPKSNQSSFLLTPTELQALLRTIGHEGSHLQHLADYVSRISQQPLLDGNQVRLLEDGDVAYSSMLAAIDAAEKSIGLSTYIFDNDEAGTAFVEALARAKKRGVEVRVIIDDVGTRYSWPSIKGQLRRHQIPFTTFLPTLIPWQLQYTNLRNHRKLLIIDGRHGFTGGMNIRQGHRATNPGRYPIHDIHFEVEGPAVAQMQETFVDDWAFCSGEELDGDAWFPTIVPEGFLLARGLPDGPDSHMDQIRQGILGALSCAQKSVTIVTPYFLPDQPLISALGVAAMRGVEVKILLPEKGNLALVQWASTAQLWQVLEQNCRIFLTPAPFDHSKIMLVDGLWSMWGSANWDTRSLRLNFEFNMEAYDPELARQLGKVIAGKLAKAKEITLADVDSRPLWVRLRDAFARLALPYL